MKPQTSEKYQLTDKVDFTFDLVSRLVSEMLAGEELTITAKSGEFFHDSDSGIEVTDSLNLRISNAGLTETGFRTVITVSGRFDNLHKENYTFSLYFIMKRIIPVIPMKEYFIDKLTGTHLKLPISSTSERLYDALFSLTLENQTRTAGTSRFGEGKGYLVFGRYL